MDTKSGKGIRDGVVSELAAFFRVTPGHEEQLREHYRSLLANADADTASLLESGIETADANIEQLESLRQFTH